MEGLLPDPLFNGSGSGTLGLDEGRRHTRHVTCSYGGTQITVTFAWIVARPWLVNIVVSGFAATTRSV
jgi:hypothetical protein